MQMNRVILHHTAGSLSPSAFDKKHYHRLVDGEGRVHAGAHAIAANAPGRRLVSGTYAAHTRNLNSGSIGVALAAMANAEWSDPRGCRAFPKPDQVEAMVQEVAKLCIEYSIEVSPRTVLSHAEVGITLGVQQAGKWDLDYDPLGISSTRDPVAQGNLLRASISGAIEDLGHEAPIAPRGDMPVLRRGSSGEAVTEAQRLLRAAGATIAADGAFGPNTWAAVVAFQKSRELLSDGIIGRMTWAALYLGEE